VSEFVTGAEAAELLRLNSPSSTAPARDHRGPPTRPSAGHTATTRRVNQSRPPQPDRDATASRPKRCWVAAACVANQIVHERSQRRQASDSGRPFGRRHGLSSM
jgi:hypothetical protein